MFGLLVITHGKMSDGIIDATDLIFGEIDNLKTLNLFPQDETSALKNKIVKAYKEVDQGDGVIILTDLLSATPFNQAMLMANELSEDKKDKTYIISGVSLPIVLEAANQNLLGVNIGKAVEEIVNSGKSGIEAWSISNTLDDEIEDDDF